VAALAEQLRRRRAVLEAGAEHVGWKIGRGLVEGEEHLEPVIGYLTSATLLEPGGVFDSAGTTQLSVDAEVAIEIGGDARAQRYGAALELVDVTRPPDDFETIVAENIWHRAVAFGPWSADAPPDTFDVRAFVNGAVREAASARADADETVAIAARLLGAVGERLEPGDRIIAGSLVHVPVARGDDVVVDLGQLGRVGASIG
jgi:2-keto-4-pentenoate hydratase